jgi:hypothetical protein
MTVKDDMLAISAEQPGLSAPEIADCLARDPRNTRRDIAAEAVLATATALTAADRETATRHL